MKFLSFFILIFLLSFGIHKNREYFFEYAPEDISRKIYGLNPFVESQKVGTFIKRNSDPDDKIAVLGSEPQIYFHADRLSATGYIYTYPLIEIHDYTIRMQEQMIQQIEDAEPEILVMVDISKSWLRKTNSPGKIFTWMLSYPAKHNYSLIGTVELYSDITLYKFTQQDIQEQPVSKYRLRIYKKE